jgi:restriction system protein
MTIFQVSRNNAEFRIRALLEGRQTPITSDRGTREEPNDINESQRDPATIALDKITDHISRKFRGHELERLVEAVLVAQGFVSRRHFDNHDRDYLFRV